MRLPGNDQRIAVVGRTGSGKTVFGAWLLSLASWPYMPWTIFDFKRDKLLRELPATEIKITDKPPHKPGLYIARPFEDQQEEVEKYLWRVWEQENHGIYIDEGYMLKNGPAFRACMTQGRSKHIPMIILSQRPVNMPLTVFTEADFFSVFHLNYSKDSQRVIEYIGDQNKALVNQRLEPYHSLYYDVGLDQLTALSPVPGEAVILETFNRRAGGGPRNRIRMV